ncbi:Hypothetical predicted protein, partial [Paramuricea clavata]
TSGTVATQTSGESRVPSTAFPKVAFEDLDPQNQTANGVLWSKCPKTKFCGARHVRIAVCETVAVFNTGAASKAVIMNLCGVTPGVHTMRALRKQDDTRLKLKR